MAKFMVPPGWFPCVALSRPVEDNQTFPSSPPVVWKKQHVHHSARRDDDDGTGAACPPLGPRECYGNHTCDITQCRPFFKIAHDIGQDVVEKKAEKKAQQQAVLMSPLTLLWVDEEM
eukprot:5239903-Amphidinium_carterae.2